MRSFPWLVVLVPLLGSPTTSGCQKKPDREEALRSLHDGLSGLEGVLGGGPSTWVVSGPKEPAAPFLEDGSRWAAEELAAVLRREGFDDLVGSKDEPAAKPVGDVEVVLPDPVSELTARARREEVRVIVFVALRSIELHESTPTYLEWTYDGSVEIVETDSDAAVAWAVTGTTQSEMPNDVPQEPDGATRPLAQRWARKALGMGALAMGALGATAD
jgi:hypothetical protein